jgi:hypothetical protein
MPLSAYAKDRFIAPQMSKFTSAQIPDVSDCDPEQEHWVENFILNTLAGRNVKPPYRQYMFNFLRRTADSFREYSLARERTLALLRGRENVSLYLAAIGHWEVFLSHAWNAYRLLSYLAGQKGQGIYVPDDVSSPLKRLNDLHNWSKHVEKRIFSEQIPDEDTLAVWLDNDGLRSSPTANGKSPGSYLTCEEMATDILRDDLAVWADRIQNPMTLAEKLEAHGGPHDEPVV